MSSSVIRLPDDTAASVKSVAALYGETPGTRLAQAWAEYLERHQEEFGRQFNEVARMMRENDIDGLVKFQMVGAEDRAAEAAAALRSSAH